MTQKKNKKMYNVLKNNTCFYDKLYISLFFLNVWTIRSTITFKATVYIIKVIYLIIILAHINAINLQK